MQEAGFPPHRRGHATEELHLCNREVRGEVEDSLASYLDARHHQGRWLVRIEDIDPPREQPGATAEILRALESHGLCWDEEVLYQSQRTELYRETASRLVAQRLAFYCHCSRLQLQGQSVYPGNCRKQFTPPKAPAAIRVIAQGNIDFIDRIQGYQHHNMTTDIGDFIIFRKDNLAAYQLATALDDALQGITHVVRGSDLLDSTPRQIYLQQTLKTSSPSYAHIPVLANANGQKLSKQNLATPLNLNNCQQNLLKALRWLNQNPPEELISQPAASILNWAKTHWSIKNIAPVSSIQID